MARIISAFRPENRPKAVTRWEQQANDADSDQVAQTQLLYQMLVELRGLKVLLIWLLLIIPIIVGVVLAVMTSSATGYSNDF